MLMKKAEKRAIDVGEHFFQKCHRKFESSLGYPFVLPDMIGGNGYGDDPLDESTIPSREMYIRWLQANVFMPGNYLEGGILEKL